MSNFKSPGKNEKQDPAPTKWKWTQVKQSGLRPSARCGCSMAVTSASNAVVFGGVFDEVNLFNSAYYFLAETIDYCTYFFFMHLFVCPLYTLYEDEDGVSELSYSFLGRRRRKLKWPFLQ